MARLIGKLSSIAVTKTKQPGYYGDGGGLWLQVSISGTKSWIFRFTRQGRQREMGLGPLYTVSLAEAREKAKACRQQLLDGHDPLEVRDAARLAAALEQAKALTFDQCATDYIKAHRAGWRNAKHASQWESTLATYASPVFGALPVASVDTPLVMKVLNSIWTEKTETASRLRGRIESVLGWATTSGYRTGDNPARWRGHLENLLPAPEKVKKVEHHPALPWQQIGAFMADLRAREGIAARALEFLILTAARSGEVRGMRWDEVEDGCWTVPAERMKAGKEHRVPLSDSAIALLEKMPRLGDYVFPGAKKGALLSDMSLTAVLRRMSREGITVHGFRSSFRMWAAEATNFPREVAEHALAHQLPDKVEAAYRRGDLYDKRKLLMQGWAEYVSRSLTDAAVIEFRPAA
jgi:integrase